MSDTETKKLLNQIAAEMGKPKGAQNKGKIAALQKKLDAALGLDMGDSREEPAGLLGDYGHED